MQSNQQSNYFITPNQRVSDGAPRSQVSHVSYGEEELEFPGQKEPMNLAEELMELEFNQMDDGSVPESGFELQTRENIFLESGLKQAMRKMNQMVTTSGGEPLPRSSFMSSGSQFIQRKSFMS